MREYTLSLLFIAFGAAAGQNTANLGAFEASTTYQIAIGANSHLIPNGYAGGINTAIALDASAHHKLPGAMNLRFDAWLIDRTSVDPNAYVYDRYRYDDATGQSFILEPTNAWLLAAVVSGSFPIHLGKNLLLEPAVGLGVVPIARASFKDIVPGLSGPSFGARSSRTAHGFVVAGGVSLRWHHLVIEQHILQITGADNALGNGENSPLIVGWRF